MKSWYHFSFIIPLTIFLVHQIMQKLFAIDLPFIDAYMDPFCLGALAMHVYFLERKWFFNIAKISFLSSSIIFLFLSIVSELILPRLSPQFHSDWFDVLAISLGIIWFQGTYRVKIST